MKLDSLVDTRALTINAISSRVRATVRSPLWRLCQTHVLRLTGVIFNKFISEKKRSKPKALGLNRMTRIWSSLCIVVFSLVGASSSVIAQQNTDQLSGYWRQKEASVYIQVVNSGGSYEAEIVRNDWEPGLVGTKLFHNVVAERDKKNSWAGNTPISGSSQLGTTTLKMNRSGELRSRHKPGGRATWVRSEPIEKRY